MGTLLELTRTAYRPNHGVHLPAASRPQATPSVSWSHGRILVALGLLVLAPTRLAISAPTETHVLPDTLVVSEAQRLVCSATQATAFLVQPYMQVPDTTDTVIAKHPVLTSGVLIDSTRMHLLCTLLQESIRIDKLNPTNCIYFPRYGLRIVGDGGVLEVLVGTECGDWMFYLDRVPQHIPSCWYVQDRLPKVFAGLFPDSTEARWRRIKQLKER